MGRAARISRSPCQYVNTDIRRTAYEAQASKPTQAGMPRILPERCADQDHRGEDVEPRDRGVEEPGPALQPFSEAADGEERGRIAHEVRTREHVAQQEVAHGSNGGGGVGGDEAHLVAERWMARARRHRFCLIVAYEPGAELEAYHRRKEPAFEVDAPRRGHRRLAGQEKGQEELHEEWAGGQRGEGERGGRPIGGPEQAPGSVGAHGVADRQVAPAWHRRPRRAGSNPPPRTVARR